VGNTAFKDTVALTLGAVSAVGTIGAVTGITATGQTVALSGKGGISEAAGDTISATNLSVLNITSGNVVLDQGNTVTTFAASNTAGSTGFNDTIALTIGAVSAVGTIVAVTGITATGQTVALAAVGGISEATGDTIAAGSLSAANITSGNIILDQSNAVGTFASSNTVGNTAFKDTVALTIGTVSAVGTIGAVTGITATGQTVALSGQGGISEAAGDTITATNLSVLNITSGNVVLDQANKVTTFAASNTAGSTGFNDTIALTIGAVSAVGNLGAVTGITATGQTVSLAAAGGISEVTGDTIAAGSLSALNITSGNIILDQLNAVGTFAASNTVGNTAFKDTVALTIGAVSAVGTMAAVTGITATGQTVALSGQGGISEGTGDTIAAANLSVLNIKSGNVVLDQGNAVGTFASSNTVGSTGFKDTVALTIGAVSAVSTLGAQTGITATGQTVALSGKGGISEAAGITIASTSLSVVNITSGNVILDQGNVVTTFASSSTAGSTVFNDTTALTIDLVSSVGGLGAQSGVTTNAGDITLATAGAMLVNQAVTTGSNASGTVRLQAAGDVSGPGVITALALGVNAPNGSISLANANDVTTFASFSNGPTTFFDNTNLTIGAVAAMGSLFQVPSVGNALGVTTTNGNIDLKTTNTATGLGLLTIAAPIVSKGVGDIVTIDVPNSLANLKNTLNPTLPTLLDATVSGAIPFTVNAATEVDLPSTITTNSASGTSITSGPGPLLVNLTVASVESVTINDQGQATLTLQVGRGNESGYFATIFWNPLDKTDVTSNQYIQASNGTSQFTISHTYTANELQQLGNNAFAVQIFLSHPQTQFLVNGSPVPTGTGSQISNETVITFPLSAPAGRLPPLDLQNILGIPIEVVSVQVTLPPPQTLVLPPQVDPLPLFVPLADSTGLGTASSQLGIPYLRFLKPDGTILEKEIGDDDFQNLLRKDLPKDVRAALFEKLDIRDGRYQVLLRPTKGASVERTVLDVYIKQGQPIDYADFDEDAGETQGPPEAGQPGAGGEQGRLDRTDNFEERHGEAVDVSLMSVDAALLPADVVAPPAGPRLETNSEPERETENQRGNSRTMSQVPLIGAAIACEGLRRRWQQQTEVELQKAKNRPLTKAGRLYARIRRQAEQPSNSVSE
jgi:hypothetical protein